MADVDAARAPYLSPERLKAFSDAVLAVIITIMVLEIKAPAHGDLMALQPLIPVGLAYILSFTLIGIYWNNHHHLLAATERIDGRVMWANLHLLFWLSLMPFATSWVGEHYVATWPAVIFGVIALMSGIAYYVLARFIVRANPASKVATAIGRDTKGLLSELCYAAGIGLAFVHPFLSYAFYTLVSIIWFVPDKRLGRSQKAKKSLV